MIEGKLPPQAPDIEPLILGAIMIDGSCVDIAMAILHEDSFYKESHQLIFNAARRLYNKREPIDISTVAEELKNTDKLELIGGSFYISQLTYRVASGANIEYHCRIVEQYAIGRRVLMACQKAISDIYDDPVSIFEHINFLNSRLTKPDIAIQGNDPSPTYRINKAVKQIEKAMDGKDIGISTGITELDKYTGGWQDGDLIIIAARPGMGKSAWGINIAHNAIKKAPVFMIQMEMSAEQVAMREIAMETGIKIQTLRTGNIFEEQKELVDRSAQELKEKMFFIDFESNGTIMSITSKIIKAKREHKISLAMIDYLQLIEPPKGENTAYVIGKITAAFKRLAKELSIPIIMFSQLNREVEKRGDKRPQLSDLRDSGSIEADADQVIFIYRPDYYQEDPRNERGESLLNKIDLIIAKNRQGGTGDVWVHHDLSCNIITNEQSMIFN